jgi:hypothetical protein
MDLTRPAEVLSDGGSSLGTLGIAAKVSLFIWQPIWWVFKQVTGWEETPPSPVVVVKRPDGSEYRMFAEGTFTDGDVTITFEKVGAGK